MVFKNPYHGRQRLPSSPHSTAKGVPAEITFHRATPSNCYKEILFEEESILEPIGVDEEKVIRFTPQELGQHEFSCGMKMQKGSYTVVEKTRKSLSLLQRFGLLVSLLCLL